MIKLSILVLALIAVFIALSTTFTVAHAQTAFHPRHNPNNVLHGLILGVIGTGFLTVPQLVPIISSALLGSNASFDQFNGSVINGLIG